MAIPSHPSDPPLDQLDYVAYLKRRFKFRVDESTMEFWTAKAISGTLEVVLGVVSGPVACTLVRRLRSL